MNRFLRFCGASAFVFAIMFCWSARPAHALLIFDDQIDINLSTLGIAGVSDTTLIERLDFDGRLAINGTNTGTTPGGAAQDGTSPFAGIALRVVGFADNVDGERNGAMNFNGLGDATEFGHTTAFEVTAIIRDWNSNTISVDASDPTAVDVTVTYDTFVRTDAGGINAFPSGTGFIDLYLDTSPDFSNTDAERSSDGVWLGTFGITQDQAPTPGTEPRTVFTFDSTLAVLNGGGDTRVVLQLIAAASNDLFQTTTGLDLLGGGLVLFTLTNSVEEVIPNPPLTNISGGAGDPVNTGAGFVPATSFVGAGFTGSNFPNDVVSRFDSANTFAVVPEPTSLSLLAMGAFGTGLAAVRRRRRQKTAA